MINLGRVTLSSNFSKPKAFIILRKQGTWLNGRFITEDFQLESSGIIDPLNSKEINMLPEGDQIMGGVRIYTKTSIHTTRNNNGDSNVSDEIKFHDEFYKVYQVNDYSDQGYYKVIAVRKLGS